MYLTDRGPRVRRTGASGPRARVGSTVVLLGLVSLLTDVSSESVSAVLALYLTTVVGLGPLGYGFVDGLYQGVSALVRLLGGWTADRTDRPKWVAAAGYGLSMLTRVALVTSTGAGAVTASLVVDRVGKGLRTAPRDAVIAASSTPASLGRSFGVHRALDTAGAVLGPVAAFLVLLALPGRFRAVFVVSLAAALLGFALLVLVVPDVRPRRASPTATALTLPTGTPAAVRGTYRRILLATALLGVLTVGDGFLYLGLARHGSFAAASFPLLYVGTSLVYLVLALPLGVLADRIGRGTVFVLGHVALLGSYACVVLSGHGVALVVGCLGLLGVYYAATDGQLAALVGGSVGEATRATAIAGVQTAQALARLVSSVLFGLMWSLTSLDWSLLVVSGALMVVLLAATSLLWRR